MYDVSTFQLVNKTFFPTQTAASLFLGVSAHSINKYLDKNIAIKNKNDSLLYLCFSSEQNFEKLKAILSVTQIPTNEDARIVHNSQSVWVYDQRTLALINNNEPTFSMWLLVPHTFKLREIPLRVISLKTNPFLKKD